MESMLGRFELTRSFCNQHCCFPGPKFRTKNKEICLESWDITVAQTKMKLRLLGNETAIRYSPLHLARTTVVAIIFDAGDHPALSHWFHIVCQRTLTLIWKHKPKNISSETLQTQQNFHSTIKQILLPKPYILEIICAAGGCYHTFVPDWWYWNWIFLLVWFWEETIHCIALQWQIDIQEQVRARNAKIKHCKMGLNYSWQL